LTYEEENQLSRTEALRLYTEGSAWSSGDDVDKGRIEVGQLADLAVLSSDYFSLPEENIKEIELVLTIMDGKIVHGSEEFGPLAPPLPPVSPDWSPTGIYGGNHHVHPFAVGQSARHAQVFPRAAIPSINTPIPFVASKVIGE
jgi:hypothetical protein